MGLTNLDMIIYRWGQWPEHLLTKKQMSEAGYQTGKKLPAPAGKVRRSKSPDGWMYLYDKSQGVPKRQMSEKQEAALQKAQEQSKLVYVTCIQCADFILNGSGYPLAVTQKKYNDPRYRYNKMVCDICRDRAAAVAWAVDLLAGDFVILDTETTGLDNPEIVQIAVIDKRGNPLIDTLVNPVNPPEPGAVAIHGLTMDILENAPGFGDLYGDLYKIFHGRRVVIYNADFDRRALRVNRRLYRLPPFGFRQIDCAMNWYAQYYGDWSEYWQDYRWQPLPGGDHTALGDCLATLELIKMMANYEG